MARRIIFKDGGLDGGVVPEGYVSFGVQGGVVSTKSGEAVSTVSELADANNYIFVAAKGSAPENAKELENAYSKAIEKGPTSENRVRLVVSPGYFNFGNYSFEMTYDYIDLVSMDANPSIIFMSDSENLTQGTIVISANDVYVKGVDVSGRKFTISDQSTNVVIENCRGGDNSFGGYGKYINCVGGAYSFGDSGSNSNGEYNNCIGEELSFGGSGTASGIYTNCVGGFASFGFRNMFSENYVETFSGSLYSCRVDAGFLPIFPATGGIKEPVKGLLGKSQYSGLIRNSIDGHGTLIGSYGANNFSTTSVVNESKEIDTLTTQLLSYSAQTKEVLTQFKSDLANTYTPTINSYISNLITNLNEGGYFGQESLPEGYTEADVITALTLTDTWILIQFSDSISGTTYSNSLIQIGSKLVADSSFTEEVYNLINQMVTGINDNFNTVILTITQLASQLGALFGDNSTKRPDTVTYERFIEFMEFGQIPDYIDLAKQLDYGKYGTLDSDFYKFFYNYFFLSPDIYYTGNQVVIGIG